MLLLWSARAMLIRVCEKLFFRCHISIVRTLPQWFPLASANHDCNFQHACNLLIMLWELWQIIVYKHTNSENIHISESIRFAWTPVSDNFITAAKRWPGKWERGINVPISRFNCVLHFYPTSVEIRVCVNGFIRNLRYILVWFIYIEQTVWNIIPVPNTLI